MPYVKYRPFLDVNPVELPDRQWPSRRITKAPRWLTTDLRDGNQSLMEPMDPKRKRELFDMLVKLGFKEIEIGFPAASQTDFDFVRSLVTDGAVPEDVTVSVLTQSRTDLIHRTIDALEGLPRATVHLYNATAPLFREVVFRMSKPQIVDLAMAGTREIMAQAEKVLGDETIFGLEYSPEIFVDTEREFALEVCENVISVWEPAEDREIILNLPSTVERATPNVYADQIEWFSRSISHRENVCISVHPHNDRGTAVASAELALLAGADRVEGCLFGQGERTGNVDLVTVALNLFSQGIDPELELGDIDTVRRTAAHCTRMDVSERHPYVGDLVYTSFSGSHQDAIKKGFFARQEKVKAAGGDENAVPWELPYLPIDPHDVGRSYAAVVRVNSQSGKGGIAYLMSTEHNMELPRRLQIEFSHLVQRHTDATGGEIDAATLWRLFVDEYLPYEYASELAPWGRFRLGSISSSSIDHEITKVTTELEFNGEAKVLHGEGNGPLGAFVTSLESLGLEIKVRDFAQHALGEGRAAQAAAYIEAEVNGQVLWGVGIDTSIVAASFQAMISAANRALR
ncbi:MAG: 2-isopropylmalate synthase [Buchananella hordeovulneris]|nr:2-isopropylmalate synthase [Buchananella hordeovulneris]